MADQAVVDAAVNSVHAERRQRWQKPVFGREDILLIYNLKDTMIWSDAAVAAFRDVMIATYPNGPPPHALFRNLIRAGYGRPPAVDECHGHKPYVDAMKAALAHVRRAAWQTKPFGLNELCTVYGGSECVEHIVQAVHAALVQDYPDDPPPNELFDNCYGAVCIEVYELGDHVLDGYHDHEPYMPAIRATVAERRRALWAQIELSATDYVDLFFMSPAPNGVVIALADHLRRAFKDNTHPIDPPGTDNFHAALDDVLALGRA